jgi:pyruvate-formate lyase-activating enzyme
MNHVTEARNDINSGIEECLGTNLDVNVTKRNVAGSECDVIFFVSSSGHCSLDCHYCIVNPIVKHKPSLDMSDFEFLLDAFPGKRAFLAFSGKGDFFAGYKKKDRLLDKLLDRDLQVGLDINGVMIHEFPELSDEKIDKIKAVNLTLHYEAMIVKNSLKAWERNALVLIDRIHQRGTEMLMGTILSPLVTKYWEEALHFYEKVIFRRTEKKIVLIRDVNRPLSDGEEMQLSDLEQRYGYMIERVHQEDFAKDFAVYKNVLCPAGQIYFRVWNDGTIEGCPYIPALRDAGNVKERVIRIRDELFRCNQARYCDCDLIARLGKMDYEL